MGKKLVRYVSPFGSPAWMTREEAEKYLKEDDEIWLLSQEIGALTERQREIGPPRIEAHDAVAARRPLRSQPR